MAKAVSTTNCMEDKAASFNSCYPMHKLWSTEKIIIHVIPLGILEDARSSECGLLLIFCSS